MTKKRSQGVAAGFANPHLAATNVHVWSAQNVGNVFTRLGPTLVDMTAIQAAVDQDIPVPLAAR